MWIWNNWQSNSCNVNSAKMYVWQSVIKACSPILHVILLFAYNFSQIRISGDRKSIDNVFSSVSNSNLGKIYINGSVQDCSNSSANALELLQSCAKPSICSFCYLMMKFDKESKTQTCFSVSNFVLKEKCMQLNATSQPQLLFIGNPS